MDKKNMFACVDALERIEAYLDGELEATEATALEHHSNACPACAEELAWARRVRQELRALPPLECPPGVMDSVMAAAAGPTATGTTGAEAAKSVLSFPQRPRSAQRFAPWALRFAAAAAVVLAVLAGALLLRPTAPRPQYTAAELAQAEKEARLAFAYLSTIQRRAGHKIQQDVLVKHVVGPPQQALSRIVELPQEATEENL
jgi:anti-sigma factor RsiW